MNLDHLAPFAAARLRQMELERSQREAKSTTSKESSPSPDVVKSTTPLVLALAMASSLPATTKLMAVAVWMAERSGQPATSAAAIGRTIGIDRIAAAKHVRRLMEVGICEYDEESIVLGEDADLVESMLDDGSAD